MRPACSKPSDSWSTRADAADAAAKSSYDVILIDGAVGEVPEALTASLAPNGRLATGVDDNGVTRLAVGRVSGGALGLRRFADSEVPVLPGFSRPRAFTF
jgi:protein-L-isoaspartate(D-aspartate) O-methyltransferase